MLIIFLNSSLSLFIQRLQSFPSGKILKSSFRTTNRTTFALCCKPQVSFGCKIPITEILCRNQLVSYLYFQDPSLTAAMMSFTDLCRMSIMRWGFCAREVCFKNDIVNFYFYAGKAMPVDRFPVINSGINQLVLSHPLDVRHDGIRILSSTWSSRPNGCRQASGCTFSQRPPWSRPKNSVVSNGVWFFFWKNIFFSLFLFRLNTMPSQVAPSCWTTPRRKTRWCCRTCFSAWTKCFRKTRPRKAGDATSRALAKRSGFFFESFFFSSRLWLCKHPALWQNGRRFLGFFSLSSSSCLTENR